MPQFYINYNNIEFFNFIKFGAAFSFSSSFWGFSGWDLSFFQIVQIRVKIRLKTFLEKAWFLAIFFTVMSPIMCDFDSITQLLYN